MSPHITPDFAATEAVAAIFIAGIYISLSSLLREPSRQKFSATIVAGAGAAYLSGGLGVWEFPFSVLMTIVAFKGLDKYYYIGIAWLLHAGWDLVHHFYGNPIVSLDASSSAGCAVCDAVLAIWFFFKAPSVIDLFRPQKAQGV